MAWQLTNVTKATDLTGSTIASSVRGVHAAYGEMSTLSFTIDDELGTIVIDPEDVFSLTDGGTKVFEGIARQVTKTDTGLASQRVYQVVCQDYTTFLDDDVVDTPWTLAAGSSDSTIIQGLFSAYGTKGVVITVGADRVQSLLGSFPVDIPVFGMTLRQAMGEIAAVTGGNFFVDFDKNLHYYLTEVLAAPFNLSDNPNLSTTFEYEDFVLPQDSVQKFNAVFVIGGESTTTPGTTISGWRYVGGTPPAAGTRRAAVLRDQEITTIALRNNRGDAFLAAHQSALEPGQLKTYRPGLRGGMGVQVTHSGWGISAVTYRIQTVEFQPVTKDRIAYVVHFGAAPMTLQAIVQNISTAVSTAYTLAQATATGDLVAPAQVTGFVLSSAYSQAADGTQWPNLVADWNPVADVDLDAYEVEIDRAIEGAVVFTGSASGSGGTLGAGEYRIYVTGLGTVYGETGRQDAYEVVPITAGQKLYVNITAKPGVASYKVYAERAEDPRYAITTSTTGSNVEVTVEGSSGGGAPTVSTAADFDNPASYRTPNTHLTVDSALGGVVYVGRARAVDDSGNRGLFSNPDDVQAQRDATAPDLVQGFGAIAGKTVVGLSWERNGEADLDRYEVRYAVDDGSGTGPGATPAWTVESTRSTVMIVTGLNPLQRYWFQARAIDTSGQVRTSDVDLTPVPADTTPDAGWNTSISAVPGLITGDDIAAGTILTSHLSALGIDASVIKTGTLAIGGQPNTPDFLIVYNTSGVEIGRWDANGLTVADPTDTQRLIRMVDGQIKLSIDGGATFTTAITPDAIMADAIKLGSAVGGHNLVPNSSFELSAFATILTKVWTSSADWTASITASDVNVNKGTTELRMTTFTY